ncbi:GTPase KRas [Pelomyxa schiedti]|nr:GTPase KRas [Pelomyxa schiedti]
MSCRHTTTSNSAPGGSDGTVRLKGQWEIVRHAEAALWPCPRNSHVAGVTVGGNLLVFGGNGDSGVLSDTLEFSFSSGTWKKIHPASKRQQFPSGRMHSSSVTYLGDVYMFGGPVGAKLSTLGPPRRLAGVIQLVCIKKACLYLEGIPLQAPHQIYIASFSMKGFGIKSPQLTPPPQMFHCAARLESRVFVFFGSQTSTNANTFSCLDLESNCWSNMQSPPALGLLRGTTCISFEGTIAFFGGKMKTGISNDVWYFQPRLNSWGVASMQDPIPALYFSTSVECQHGICLFGGIGTRGTSSELIFVSPGYGPRFSQTTADSFSDLPDDVVVTIFSLLTEIDLGKVCRVSRRFQKLGSDPSLWRYHLVSLLRKHLSLHFPENHSLLSTLLLEESFSRELYYQIRRSSSFYCEGRHRHKKELMRKLAEEKVIKRDCIRLALLGYVNVGKSAITIQLVCNHMIDEYDPTITDSYRKQWCLFGSTVMLDVLDTGTDIHDGSAPWCQQWLERMEGYLVVYSVTDAASFKEAANILRDLSSSRTATYGAGWPGVVICANKCDLVDSRIISAADGIALAMKFGCPYLELSAKKRTNIEEAFIALVLELARLKYLPITCNTALQNKSKCLVM